MNAQGRRKWVGLIGSVIALAVLGWALLDYAPATAAASLVALVILLSYVSPWRLRIALLASTVSAVLYFAAFQTTLGYFWLNRSRLVALVAQIQTVPAITSLEMGHDGSLKDGGKVRRFDDYRFLNNKLITHYRDQADPHASQPEYYVGDILRELRVPAATYNALRASLERLSLAGYDRTRDGQVRLMEPSPGSTPWVKSFLYRPTAQGAQSLRVMESRKLAAHWYYIMEG